MRIISGRFKGKVLRAPRNLPVRPTTDQAKEGLFNILHNWYDFSELKILDLFSGTGNVSYEFWSRGVEEVVAVDRHAGCVRYIREQFREMEVRGQVVKMEVGKFLAKTEGKWDLIFLDPPYGMAGITELLHQVFERELLLPEGLLILEHPSQENYEAQAHFSEARKYGGSVFSFFEK